MRSVKHYLFAVLCLVAWLGVTPAGLHTPSAFSQNRPGAVSGTVVDENGDPVIGAGIVLSADRTKGTLTDAEGRFSMTCSPVPSCSYRPSDMRTRNCLPQVE